MIDKIKSIGGNLLYALVLSILVTIGGIVIFDVFGSLSDSITNLQSKGLWWILIIIGYILSLGYILYRPVFKKNRDRKKLLFMLIWYWEEQLAKRNKPKPTKLDTGMMEHYLIKRIEVRAWFDKELWDASYPNEKYSDYLFDIVDNYLNHFEK